MKMLRGALGGCVGGLVGALIWAMVAYFIGYEIGWIALGVGFLVGFGTALAAGHEGGPALGLSAAGTALLAVLGGKLMTAHLITTDMFRGDALAISMIADILIEEHQESGRPLPPSSHPDVYPDRIWQDAERRWNAMSEQEQAYYRPAHQLLNEQLPMVWLADDLVLNRIDAGARIDWPTHHQVETAWRGSHYPGEIWQEAIEAWYGKSAQEQGDLRENIHAHLTAFNANDASDFANEVSREMFYESFSIFDIFFLVLAVSVAYSVAARSHESA